MGEDETTPRMTECEEASLSKPLDSLAENAPQKEIDGEIETAMAVSNVDECNAKRIPRLGISHILVWTLCSSIYIALVRGIRAMDDGLQDSMGVAANSSTLLQSITAGACITGLFVLVRGRIHGCREMFRNPGHWIVAAIAVSAVLLIPLSAYFAAHIGVSAWSIFAIEFYFVSPALVYLMAAICCRGLAWRLLFLAMATVLGMQGTALFFMLQDFGSILPVSATVVDWAGTAYSIAIQVGVYSVIPVLILAAVDWGRGVKRDWLHTLGLVAFVLQQAWMLIQVIAT